MLTELPQNASVLFLDMNCFFARVEQQVQPIYRGQPVAVTPYTGDTGCVIAASYEAKALGIKTGFRVGEAKRQCPKIIILPARPSLYHFYHKEIVKLLDSFSPFIRVLSIDEFSIKLTGRDRNSDKAKLMAFAIKSAFHDKIGDWLTCSVGIAPNQFLAKLAGELKKPDGLFEIRLEDLADIYQPLALRDLCGINYGVERQCNNYGIYSPSDLYKRSLSEMKRLFGILGQAWYYRLRGFEVDDISSTTKTIGHSHVLPPELRSPQGVKKVLLRLIEKAGYRLRKDGYWATRVSLGLGFLPHGHWHKSQKFPAFQDNKAFTANALHLFQSCPITSRPLMISVSAADLIKGFASPVSLFPEIQKMHRLSQAIDSINDDYGASTIYPACIFGAETSAPDRIPFGKPRFEIRNE